MKGCQFNPFPNPGGGECHWNGTRCAEKYGDVSGTYPTCSSQSVAPSSPAVATRVPRGGISPKPTRRPEVLGFVPRQPSLSPTTLDELRSGAEGDKRGDAEEEDESMPLWFVNVIVICPLCLATILVAFAMGRKYNDKGKEPVADSSDMNKSIINDPSAMSTSGKSPEYAALGHAGAAPAGSGDMQDRRTAGRGMRHSDDRAVAADTVQPDANGGMGAVVTDAISGGWGAAR